MLKEKLPIFLSFGFSLGLGFYFSGNHLIEGSRTLSSTSSTMVVSADPGPNMPPVGRSLFDFLTMQEQSDGKLVQKVPFPLERLNSLIRSRLQVINSEDLHGVLIPLGRSLQRLASAPDFYRYPRVVMGIDANPKLDDTNSINMFLNSRLYVGYNEKAEVLEILSYNESAGRYEFQLVHDYAAGKTPTIQYANRSVCLSCHQNHAPIFSDPQWTETNANPRIAAELKKAIFSGPNFNGTHYAGFPIELKSTSEPAAIDATKFNGNLIPVNQFLWQKLCDEVGNTPESSARCRAETFSLAMRMAFTGKTSENHPVLSYSQSRYFVQGLMQAWSRRWPEGFALLTPSIPDRDPLDPVPKGNPFQLSEELRKFKEIRDAIDTKSQNSNVISAYQEPLSPRPILEEWTGSADSNSAYGSTGKWIASLGKMMADSDWLQIDRWLIGASKNLNSEMIQAQCALQKDSAGQMLLNNCQGSVSLHLSIKTAKASNEVSAIASSLVVNGASSVSFDLSGKVEASTSLGQKAWGFNLVPTSADGRSIRLADGNRIKSLSFLFTGEDQVNIRIEVIKDFAIIQKALDNEVTRAADPNSVFARKPFSRYKVLRLLRAELIKIKSHPKDCCEDTARMPAAVAEADTLAGSDPTQVAAVFGNSASFIVNCGVCHRTSSAFPPNYLYGSPNEVQSQLSQCAERIWYRLSAWKHPVNDWDVSPMPTKNRLSALGMTPEQWLSSPAYTELLKQTQILLKAKGKDIANITSVNYNSLPECKGK